MSGLTGRIAEVGANRHHARPQEVTASNRRKNKVSGMKPTQGELEENAKRLKEFFRSKEEDVVEDEVATRRIEAWPYFCLGLVFKLVFFPLS